MSLVKKYKKLVKLTNENLEQSDEFIELRDFYLEMQKKGLVIKRDYALSKLDTIGFSR